jgi:hypothetical protein
MKQETVTFRYSGDITGVTRQAVFNLAQLTSDQADLNAAFKNVKALIHPKSDKLGVAAPAAPPQGADQGTYEFCFQSGQDMVSIAFSRQSLPAEIRAVMGKLLQVCKPVKL